MKRLMTGNEAIARGVLEAGIRYASAYPGTPSTEILETIAHQGGPVLAEWSVNEKVALETAIGASIAGVRSLAAMKHVGVNVAADPLFTVVYTGINAGLVLVSADDPGLHSSQNEQDNRYYAKFAKLPMLEPADSQEAKDMVLAAMDISERFDTPVLLRTTTRVNHSKSPVEQGPLPELSKKPYVKARDKYDAVPSVAKKLHLALERRLEALAEFSEGTELNHIEWNGSAIGVVAAGIAYQHAREALGEQASYFKLGFSWPLPLERLKAFAAMVDRLYVVEELEPFIEEQLQAAGITCLGKAVLPRTGELDPVLVGQAILGHSPEVLAVDVATVVERPPVLCAGCPHRGFFFELAKVKGVMITGDIGCYGLGGVEPLSAKDTCICMGASISMGHGAQKAFDLAGEATRTVAVIGDSTFFHTGMNSLLNSVFNRGRSVTCILDNRITGMTGHQENPGTGFTLDGAPTKVVEIEPLVRALGVDQVVTINPLDLEQTRKAISWALAQTEPSVVIARFPCVLKKWSEQDRSEFGSQGQRCAVDAEACIGCSRCLHTGCPALLMDPATRKVAIDAAQCTGCEVCAQVCPLDAIAQVEALHV